MSDDVDIFPTGGAVPNFALEVELAAENIRRGHRARDLLISPQVLLAATQRVRSEISSWGDRFRKDPRRFSSSPQLASAANVAAFIDGVRIQ